MASCGGCYKLGAAESYGNTGVKTESRWISALENGLMVPQKVKYRVTT